MKNVQIVWLFAAFAVMVVMISAALETRSVNTQTATATPGVVSCPSVPETATMMATAAATSSATPRPNLDAEDATSKLLLKQLPSGIRCYTEAVNSKNLEGLVASFAPDGVVIDVSRRIAGADAIRTWAQREVIGGILHILSYTKDGDVYRTIVRWSPSSAGWRAFYNFTVNVDGLITQADLQYADNKLTPAEVMTQFAQRINTGDADGVTALFAPDARFDSAGRIYPNRQAIMDRFLIAEVIRINGQYEVIGITLDSPEQVTVEYNFRAGTLFERFTYQCTVRDNLIRTCIGRYVS